MRGLIITNSIAKGYRKCLNEKHDKRSVCDDLERESVGGWPPISLWAFMLLFTRQLEKRSEVILRGEITLQQTMAGGGTEPRSAAKAFCTSCPCSTK